MYEWQWFEGNVLDSYAVGDQFTSRSLADEWEVSPQQASGWIRLFLLAQRAKQSKTRYVLSRTGRTSASVWTVGSRTADARNIVGQFGDDLRVRVRRAIEPDLQRISDVNPHARAAIEQGLEPILVGLASVVEGFMAAVGWSAAP